MIPYKAGNEKGSVLVMAAVLSFALFLLGLSYLAFVDRIVRDVDGLVVDSQARYAAMAGMMDGITYASINNPGLSYDGGCENMYNEVVSCWRIEYGGIERDLYISTSDYRVVGEGTSKSHTDISRTARVSSEVDVETFADYLYLSDVERDSVRHEIIRFWTPDTLNGKVHSNDTLHIHYVHDSPRFMKRVTSAASYLDPPDNNATFDEGYYLNQGEIHFPDRADEIRRYSGHGIWRPLPGYTATEITFSGPNIYRRSCRTQAGEIVCTPDHIVDAEIFEMPASGAQFVEGKLYIKADRGGTDILDPDFPPSLGFEGRLTVASSDTMIIVDNLVYRYSRYDRTVPEDIHDALGLISENFIMVGKDVDDYVYINAALAAINGSISVQDIYDYWVENEKQSLFIYGSLAQRNRGIVHTTDYDRRGFIQKDYFYDNRFITNPPPHFVSTGNKRYVYIEDSYPG